MLVISRKLDEGLWLDESVHIVVVEVRGNRVRLGIEAPREVIVRRDELAKPFGDRRELVAQAHG